MDPFLEEYLRTFPQFHHPELRSLYGNYFEIVPEQIAFICELPKQTLLQDFQRILEDCLHRKNFFQDLLVNDVVTGEVFSAPWHVMVFSGHLKLSEMLGPILHFIRTEAQTDYQWVGDLFFKGLGEPIKKMMESEFAENIPSILSGCLPIQDPKYRTFLLQLFSECLEETQLKVDFDPVLEEVIQAAKGSVFSPRVPIENLHEFYKIMSGRPF